MERHDGMHLVSRKSVSLLLISFLGLFYELAFIRWLPSNVLSLAYFANLVLIACFLGFGLGCLLTQKRDLFVFFPWLLLGVMLAGIAFRAVSVGAVDVDSEWIWSAYRGSKAASHALSIGMTPTLVLVFALTAGLFIPIGQRLGKLMSEFEPVHAYCINILGSILGIVAFAALSFMGAPLNGPLAWFSIAAVITLWFFLERGRGAMAGAGLALVLGCAAVAYTSKNETWSPYYSIQTKPGSNGSFAVYVNQFFHQEALNFSQNREAREKYSLPYAFRVPRTLLVLGAGTGNDVAAALLSGVAQVDAVELDPAIVELGRRRHPNRPYADARVTVIVDDARSFLQKTSKKYDMIVLGTLDSHALLAAGMSTVRLDNFMYTMECLQAVRNRLTENGIVVLMFSVPADCAWLGERLLNMCYASFPDPPPLVYFGDPKLFNLMFVGGPGLPGAVTTFSGDRSQFSVCRGRPDTANVPTDDWPYLYLAKRGVPRHYLRVVGLLLVISIASVMVLSPRKRRKLDLRFFSLGCAFLLLETKSVTTLSLLFGSTWIVNAFVFGAILVMILLANLVVLKVPIRRLELVYLCLGLSLALNFLLPVRVFLEQAFWVRSLLASVTISLPIFFAGIIFARLFKSTRDIGFVYGANLVGAVLGGFLEYTSMAVGLNSLYLLAGLFYLVSFLAARRRLGLLVQA